MLVSAKTDEAKAQAEDLKQKATAKAAELATQFDTAKADATSKLDAAAAAKEAAKAAQTKKADTAKAASEAKLALEPVSIYISRATQKLYVRRPQPTFCQGCTWGLNSPVRRTCLQSSVATSCLTQVRKACT